MRLERMKTSKDIREWAVISIILCRVALLVWIVGYLLSKLTGTGEIDATFKLITGILVVPLMIVILYPLISVIYNFFKKSTKKEIKKNITNNKCTTEYLDLNHNISTSNSPYYGVAQKDDKHEIKGENSRESNIEKKTKDIININHLNNWLDDYPWLTGHLGNPQASVWFIAENPSLKKVIWVDKKFTGKTANNQWSYSVKECELFRDAITEAGLKSGNPASNEGWNCYITNAIKEPESVKKRNENMTTMSLEEQTKRWLKVLQYEIDNGNPKVLVALGKKVERILNIMVRNGLKCPPIERIHHYSYIMLRPEAGTKRGPRHPERIVEFKESIRGIAQSY